MRSSNSNCLCRLCRALGRTDGRALPTVDMAVFFEDNLREASSLVSSSSSQLELLAVDEPGRAKSGGLCCDVEGWLGEVEVDGEEDAEGADSRGLFRTPRVPLTHASL